MAKLDIDHARVNAAITRAEITTSGEITCVIKAKAMDYPETPLAWGFGAALLLPLLLAMIGLPLSDMISAHLPAPVAGWEAAHISQHAFNRMQDIAFYGLSQLIIFLIVYALVRFTPLKLWLTPKSTRHRRAADKAREQFYARGLHKTEGHTGVMIFCALQEHYVAVIADSGIHERVGDGFWNDTVAVLLSHIKKGDLTGGFEAAVAKCGAALSEHFPPGADNPNELPDVLIEI